MKKILVHYTNLNAEDMLFQGEDGISTMYVDAVKKEFAVSSTCMNRHSMTDDIKDMFEVVKREANAGLL